MDLDLSPWGFAPAEATLIARILRSRRLGAVRVSPVDLDAAYAADRLLAAGWVDAWDRGDLRGLRATLTKEGAASLGVQLVGERGYWQEVEAVLPSPKRSRRGKVVNETDLIPGVDAAKGDCDLAAYPDKPDDGDHRRPSVLIGSSMIWDGPEELRATCRACGNRIRRPTHYCLRCDRGYGDEGKAKAGKARGARPRKTG